MWICKNNKIVDVKKQKNSYKNSNQNKAWELDSPNPRGLNNVEDYHLYHYSHLAWPQHLENLIQAY